MSLGGLFAGLVNQFLGPFCENLDGSQLSVGIFSGPTTIRDLKLKPSAVESVLNLPVRLHRGHIGCVTLDVPLTKLREKPVVVTVEDVYLQLLPKYGTRSSLSLLSEVIRVQKLKRDLLCLLYTSPSPRDS